MQEEHSHKKKFIEATYLVVTGRILQDIKKWDQSTR